MDGANQQKVIQARRHHADEKNRNRQSANGGVKGFRFGEFLFCLAQLQLNQGLNAAVHRKVQRPHLFDRQTLRFTGVIGAQRHNGRLETVLHKTLAVLREFLRKCSPVLRHLGRHEAVPRFGDGRDVGIDRGDAGGNDFWRRRTDRNGDRQPVGKHFGLNVAQLPDCHGAVRIDRVQRIFDSAHTKQAQAANGNHQGGHHSPQQHQSCRNLHTIFVLFVTTHHLPTMHPGPTPRPGGRYFAP